MSDSNRQSALSGHMQSATGLGAAHNSGGPDGSGVTPGITLSEVRPTSLMQVHGAPAEADLAPALKLKPAPAPLRACGSENLELLWNGPGQWLARSDKLDSAALRAHLETALTGTDATVTDLSQARTVIAIQGGRAKDLLAKGCPLDIDTMSGGETSSTLLGHYTVQLHCRSAEHFEIYVFRSLALSAWEWIAEEALEFGCNISA